MTVGQRVQTPDGPGVIVSFWQVLEGLDWRQDAVVELDAGRDNGALWRKIYRQGELAELEPVQDWPA